MRITIIADLGDMRIEVEAVDDAIELRSDSGLVASIQSGDPLGDATRVMAKAIEEANAHAES